MSEVSNIWGVIVLINFVLFFNNLLTEIELIKFCFMALKVPLSGDSFLCGTFDLGETLMITDDLHVNYLSLSFEPRSIIFFYLGR